MKRFSTLFALAAFMLLCTTAFSQVSQGFESQAEVDALKASCWKFINIDHTTSSPIAGTGSLVSQLGTTGEIITPFINVPASLTISFSHTEIASQSGEKKIQIFVERADGTRAKIESFNSGTGSFLGTFTNSNTPGFSLTGVRRIVIQPSPNVSLKIDDLVIGASYQYGQVCNRAPIGVDDTFFPMAPTAYSDNVITNTFGGSDSDPDNETLTATLVDAPDPALGTIVFSSNGSFTFTPVTGFVSGIVTFTYRISDNGYTPLTSNLTTVTLEYAAPISLPIKLMSFAGSASNNMAQLKWSVADNETGERFEVLRSADARSFAEAGVVFINNKPGAESYSFADGRELDAVTYYKLRIVNKDGSETYSNVIALKSATTKSTTGITILKNPVESTLTFTYSATTAAQGQVSIYNTLGVKVYSSRIASQKGTNAVSLNLDSHMAAGTYILEVVSGSDRAVTRMNKR